MLSIISVGKGSYFKVSSLYSRYAEESKEELNLSEQSETGTQTITPPSLSPVNSTARLDQVQSFEYLEREEVDRTKDNATVDSSNWNQLIVTDQALQPQKEPSQVDHIQAVPAKDSISEERVEEHAPGIEDFSEQEELSAQQSPSEELQLGNDYHLVHIKEERDVKEIDISVSSISENEATQDITQEEPYPSNSLTQESTQSNEEIYFQTFVFDSQFYNMDSKEFSRSVKKGTPKRRGE